MLPTGCSDGVWMPVSFIESNAAGNPERIVGSVDIQQFIVSFILPGTCYLFGALFWARISRGRKHSVYYLRGVCWWNRGNKKELLLFLKTLQSQQAFLVDVLVKLWNKDALFCYFHCRSSLLKAAVTKTVYLHRYCCIKCLFKWINLLITGEFDSFFLIWCM